MAINCLTTEFKTEDAELVMSAGCITGSMLLGGKLFLIVMLNILHLYVHCGHKGFSQQLIDTGSVNQALFNSYEAYSNL